jgi:hypothetical protein
MDSPFAFASGATTPDLEAFMAFVGVVPYSAEP